MRAALALCAVAVSACVSVPRPKEVTRDTQDAHVAALALKFPKEGEGLCTLTLAVPGRRGEDGDVGDLTWELWLEGHPFAAGVARPQLKLPHDQWGLTTLELPLGFRNLGWSVDPRPVRVRFRGRLVRRFGLDAPETELDEQRTVVSEGAPLFNRGGALLR